MGTGVKEKHFTNSKYSVYNLTNPKKYVIIYIEKKKKKGGEYIEQEN